MTIDEINYQFNIDIGKYIVEPDKFTINFVDSDVEKQGLTKFLNYAFKELDCTTINKDGHRHMQTNGYRYKSVMTQIYYALNQYGGNFINQLTNTWIMIHKTNIKFEEEHPPVVYATKGKSNVKQNKKETKEKKEKEVKPKVITPKVIQNIIGLKFKTKLV